MIPETFLKLQQSESVVSHMASRILSAYISSGQLTNQNEDELIERSLLLAIKLAQKADSVIESDDESRE